MGTYRNKILISEWNASSILNLKMCNSCQVNSFINEGKKLISSDRLLNYAREFNLLAFSSFFNSYLLRWAWIVSLKS